MNQTLERKPFFGSGEVQGVLSEQIIPAVPGEYYAYPHEFTKERRLYVLMKCKSNKARAIKEVGDLGREANFLFLFDGPNQARILGIKEAQARGLLGSFAKGELFDESWVAPAGITAESFHKLYSNKNVSALVDTCKLACADRRVSVTLKRGVVIAMMTSGGKYGLFLVNKLTSSSISVDACHILL